MGRTIKTVNSEQLIVDSEKTILTKLKRALEFYQELGFEYLPIKLVQKSRSAEEQKLKISETHSLYEGTSELSSFRTSKQKESAFKSLREEIGDCQRCKLSANRKNIVFGEGSPQAELMFVGEGPGRDEDLQGRPFVGDAGKLLTSLIEKMGFKREDVYIANIVKCRPPMNRDPEEDEIKACKPFVEEQIRIINPKVIISLGRISAQSLLNTKIQISKLRGRFYDYMNIPVMPTFHPAYLLRNPKDKWLTWEDALKVLEKLNK